MARYAGYAVQTILVPKRHRDVVAHGLRGALAVARRHGDVVGMPEEDRNYIRFRQFDPALAAKGEYVTLRLPSGVLVISARLAPAVAQQSVRKKAGKCSPRARARVICEDEYISRDDNVRLRARTTRAEHDALPDIATVGTVMGRLGRSRVSLTTKRLGVSKARGRQRKVA